MENEYKYYYMTFANDSKLRELRKYEIYDFYNEMKKYCKTTKDYKKDFLELNDLLDEKLGEVIELLNQNGIDYKYIYNLFAINTLVDKLYYQLKNEKEDLKFINFYRNCENENNTYYKLINLLYENNSLSHKDIAKKLNISPTNLSNYINKISEYDFLYKFHRPDNKKSQFYSLGSDVREILGRMFNNNNIKLKFSNIKIFNINNKELNYVYEGEKIYGSK